MTLLSSRPGALLGRSSGRSSGGSSSGAEATPGWPLATAAGVAGAGAAAVGLVVCMSIALTGWFLADAGSHGETTDALRVGADGWLARPRLAPGAVRGAARASRRWA